MSRVLNLLVFLVLIMILNGCVLTKILTVPMRVGGAVISIVPVAGNSVHDAVDVAAEAVDDIPI